LEDLYQKYKDKNFVILGFPCNQFGWQEPGADSEIQSFCSLNYGVTFPVLSKVDVNGSDAHPVYQFLKANAPSAEGSGIMSAAFNLSSAM
jgi:glutathione peroxidase